MKPCEARRARYSIAPVRFALHCFASLMSLMVSPPRLVVRPPFYVGAADRRLRLGSRNSPADPVLAPQRRGAAPRRAS